MNEQIIGARRARKIHQEACRIYPLVAWLVTKQPSRFVARLLTGRAELPYRLVADSLSELHMVLPRPLVRCDPLPDAPPEVIELWFSLYRIGP
jgi:hypothetical protein